jgi:hypothetical protein
MDEFDLRHSRKIPEHRQVPAAAAMSDTVQMRLDEDAEYHPENLNLQNG